LGGRGKGEAHFRRFGFFRVPLSQRLQNLVAIVNGEIEGENAGTADSRVAE
jgi:hypothetical protein